MTPQELLTFPRELGLKRAIVEGRNQYSHFLKRMRDKTSCYTSLYSFERIREGKPDYTSAVIDRAWWDFDAGERGGIEQVKQDVAKLISRLEGDIRVVATGRGFHVHQLFNQSVVGHEYRLPLEHYQRRKAKGLPTLDGVGFPEKMTRIPNTYNPKRGRWCVVIKAEDFVNDPMNFPIPKMPKATDSIFHPFGKVNPSVEAFDFSSWADKYAPEAEDYSFAESVVLDDNTLSAGSVPLMPCLARGVHQEAPNHHVRVALVQHMADALRDYADPRSLTPQQKNKIEDEIFDYIKGLHWKNWNPTVSRKGIRTNLNYKRVPSCAWFVARGMCASKCWRYDGTVEIPDNIE